MGTTTGRIGMVVAAALVAACGTGTNGPTVAPPIPASPTAPPQTAVSSAAPSAAARLTLVALGDSIPYNSEDDCAECIGFVDQYADALEAATGGTVTVVNNSEHNSQTIDGFLAGLSSQNRAEAIAAGDAVIVGIAHNDVPMNRDDDSCDGTFSETPDWSRFTDACLKAELDRFRPSYEAAFARVAELRAGKPTILRMINRYNDWTGWPGHELPPKGVAATVKVIAAWNEMMCTAAEANGFTCADISGAFNGADGTRPSGDLLAGDYTHPSQKGNDLIAETLIDLGFAALVP